MIFYHQLNFKKLQNMIKNFLLIVLLILAIAMLYIGITGKIIPPALTGVGFLVIAYLFYDKKI